MLSERNKKPTVQQFPVDRGDDDEAAAARGLVLPDAFEALPHEIDRGHRLLLRLGHLLPRRLRLPPLLLRPPPLLHRVQDQLLEGEVAHERYHGAVEDRLEQNLGETRESMRECVIIATLQRIYGYFLV